MRELQGISARLIDAALIIAGAAISSQIRFGDLSQRGFFGAFVLFSAAFALAIFPEFGVYGSWRGRAKGALAGQVALAWLFVQGCALVLMASLHSVDFVSRLWILYWTVLSGGAMIACRLLVHSLLARARRAGLNLHQVAVVGSGRHCEAVMRRIDAEPASGFRVAAVFHTHAEAPSTRNPRIPVFGTPGAFADFVRRTGVHEVWLAMPLSEERTILGLVDAFRDELVNLRFLPDVHSLALFGGSGVIDLLGVPAINLAASPLPPASLVRKEAFDRLFAALVLVLLAPLFAVLAAAVKLSSPGPVLFKQRRKGADGRVFTIYKFRTMRTHTETAGVVMQATRGDQRVTKVGAFLRRTSLDELPQFFNVLRGDMSVVGPRPHALEHDDLYQKVVNGYIHRYRIKPGITGWAQVNGLRGETDRIEKMERRVQHDLYYLTNWSFALDMRIIAATVFKGFVHRNAY